MKTGSRKGAGMTKKVVSASFYLLRIVSNAKPTGRKTGKGNRMEEIKKVENEKEIVEEKIFTQDEVNEIIRKRLRERKKEQEEGERYEEEIKTREKEITEREKELGLREVRMSCKEYLHENDYPEGLIEVLDTSDFKTFKEKAGKIAEMYSGTLKNKGSYPGYEPEPEITVERKSFLNSKHKPKYAGVRNW